MYPSGPWPHQRPSTFTAGWCDPPQAVTSATRMESLIQWVWYLLVKCQALLNSHSSLSKTSEGAESNGIHSWEFSCKRMLLSIDNPGIIPSITRTIESHAGQESSRRHLMFQELDHQRLLPFPFLSRRFFPSLSVNGAAKWERKLHQQNRMMSMKKCDIRAQTTGSPPSGTTLQTAHRPQGDQGSVLQGCHFMKNDSGLCRIV